MPDLWDTNSDHVFPTPGEQPDSALSGHDDHSQEVRLRDTAADFGSPPTS
jgi:hypothetical protein